MSLVPAFRCKLLFVSTVSLFGVAVSLLLVSLLFHPPRAADAFCLGRPSKQSLTTLSERRQRMEPRQRPTRNRPPRQSSSSTVKRAPHQFDHTKEEARPFIDALSQVQAQNPNHDAPVYDMKSGGLKCMSSTQDETDEIKHSHFELVSLDDLFPKLDFSATFSSSASFRNDMRQAIREGIFDSTPTYANLSEKARRMLLFPDSSLQGSWRCESSQGRMEKLTRVLEEHLGPQAPSGDDFMNRLGSLCGSGPSTHWMDIVGITDRKIPHSWHQDTGRSRNGDTKTVMLGFPKDDNYEGTGVFSHVVKLAREQVAADDHPTNEPLVYAGTVEEEFIVRPRFAPGQEILVYRDIDVLHSAPDVAYRASVMRFM